MAHVTQDHIKTVEKLIAELSSEDKPTYANLEVILSLSEILNRARVSRGPCHLCRHYLAEEEDGLLHEHEVVVRSQENALGRHMHVLRGHGPRCGGNVMNHVNTQDLIAAHRDLSTRNMQHDAAAAACAYTLAAEYLEEIIRRAGRGDSRAFAYIKYES